MERKNRLYGALATGEYSMIKHFWIQHKKAWSVLKVVITIMVMLSGTSPAFAQNPAQEKYDEAIVNYKWGDYDKAVVSFDELLTQYPASDLADDIQFMLGQCYVRLGRDDDAIFAFYTAAYKYPRGNRQEDALYALAGALYRQDYKQQALEAYEQLVTKYPGSRHAAYAQTCIGWLYGGMGVTEKAKAELKKVVINYPDSPYVETARQSLKMHGVTEDNKKLSNIKEVKNYSPTADSHVDKALPRTVAITVFEVNGRTIKVNISCRGLETDMLIHGQIRSLDTGKVLQVVPTLLPPDGKASLDFVKPFNDWSKGEYKVSILVNENEIGTKRFSVP